MAMQAGIAAMTPARTMASGGMPLPASEVMIEKATMAPIITTSPWAKLISWITP